MSTITIAEFNGWLASFKSGRAGSWMIEFGMEPTEKNQAWRITDCEGVLLTVTVTIDAGAVGLMAAEPPIELEAATPAATAQLPPGWEVETPPSTTARNPAQIIADANARIRHKPTITP